MDWDAAVNFKNTHKVRQSWTQFEAIWIAIICIFCLSCVFVSYLVPRSKVETALINGRVVVTRSQEGLQPGDVIESIGGKPVNTRSEYFYYLAKSGLSSDITVIRSGTEYVRPLTFTSFEGNQLPAGLSTDDKATAISFGGDYLPLENVDLHQLRQILGERPADTASVIFKRSGEKVRVTLEMGRSFGRTLWVFCSLLFCVLMGIVGWRGRNNSKRSTLANGVIGLGAMATVWVSMGAALLSMPILFMIGMVCMALVKAVDVDYHLHTDQAEPPEAWVRVVLYIIPLISVITTIILCVPELPMLWGGANNSSSESRLESFSIIPYVIAILYTLLDGGISGYRIYHGRRVVPRDIAIFIASFISFISFFSLWSDPATARWAVVAIIIIQCIGNSFEFIKTDGSKYILQLSDELFSSERVLEIIKDAESILNDKWVVQVVVDRPEPHHVVSVALDDEGESVSGLSLRVLSETWRDFLELYYIEGMTEGEDSPVSGIAERLGIVYAQVVSEQAGGSLSRITLLVSTREMPSENSVSDSLSISQREALGEIANRLAKTDIALVYLSSEMSLEYLGDDLNEIAKHIHQTASFPRALHDPTIPLRATELPHGLLDEDEISENVDDDVIEIKDPEQGVDDYSTKVFEEEVNLLRSQVFSMCSQQMRAFALAEIEFTRGQKRVLDDMESLETPLIILGEHGTGKTVLSLSAHRERCDGTFQQIDALEIPETILALELFGDDSNPGMIRGALGGSLLIKNADRLSTTILSDIMESLDNLASVGGVDLYMTVTVSDEELSKADSDSMMKMLPERVRALVEHTEAECVCVPALRDQVDIIDVAEFFMHRQAMRCEKELTRIEQKAQIAIRTYRWPGNISELRAVIERAVMRSEGSELTVHDLGADFEALVDADTKNVALDEADIYREQVEHMQELVENQQAQIDRLNAQLREFTNAKEKESDDLFDGTFDEIEKKLIVRLLEKYGNDVDKTVEALSTNRSKFFNKLRKYNLY